MNEKRIEDYALIGDGETAALVARDGTIEWLCLPRFDSEACCAALLGEKENGCWSVTVCGEVLESTRRYRGDSLILETDITCKSGKVRLIDFMPVRTGAPDVVRIVECLEGEVEVLSELLLRFEYGRIHPLVRNASPTAFMAISGPDGVILHSDTEIAFEDRRFSSRIRLSQEERSCSVLTWFPSHEDAPEPSDPLEALKRTEELWAEWASAVNYSGDHREAVVRSLITLKALIHQKTGGIIAAPTSSLPETPGGARNWDYRFCWLRDATFTLLALVRSGLYQEAEAWVAWLRRAVGGDPVEVRPFYSVAGDHRSIEWQADWLPGFNGAQPVRFGNLAERQLQLDIYGEVIDALYQARVEGISNKQDSDILIRLLAGKLEDIWREPDAGIWESRGPKHHHTYSKVMCWVAFDRAARWLQESDGELARHYRQLADEVHAQVLENGFDHDRNAFVRAYDDSQLDAAVLRIPLVEFLPANDARVVSTVAAIERELCVDGLVRRYLPDRTDDGLEGSEGAFVAASFWLADVYQLQGRIGDARALFEKLLGRANDVGLLAEELSLKDDRQLGNFPQGLSHLSLVGTAHQLARRGGSVQHP